VLKHNTTEKTLRIALRVTRQQSTVLLKKDPWLLDDPGAGLPPP
jgi:hypothetical protein